MTNSLLSPSHDFSRTLRRLLGLAMAGLLLPSAQAASPLPFYEPFPSTYAEAEQLGAAGSSSLVWDFGNSTSSSCARIVDAAALAFPGLTNTGPSKGLQPRLTGTGAKNRGASLTLPAATTLYASCLFNLQYPTNNGTRPIFGLSTSSSGSSVSVNGAVVYLDDQGRLLIAKNSGTPAASTTYALPLSNTCLVVLRYKFNSGSSTDDEVALWLNPTSLGNDSNIPPPTISTTSNADVTTLGSVAYFQATSYPPLFFLDEIRVATNWAGVTPPACPAGAGFNVTGGGTVCVGAGFPVGLSGSEPGVDYWLYTNGGWSSIVVSGTDAALGFGTQSATAIYTVLASNTVTTCTSWMNGAATVANLAPPSIISQPATVSVVNGSVAAFMVVGAGDGLTYRWRKNGVNLIDLGNVSGSATANLVLSPAGAGDVATAANGYDVLITGTCTPPVTSARVGLLLIPPSSLNWMGDGVSNLWDIATSSNWNTMTATFHNGDFVTFDDNSTYTTVTLASSFLSPAAITVNGFQSFTFGGTGALVGNATTLLMNGSGTLTLNNGNTFGGGIVISNGLLSFNSATALGTGTITLAGGTLDALNVQGITVNNPINVVTDSTINIHNTSTSALVLTNALSGNAGTLSFVNATSGRGPTIVLNYPSFTFDRSVVLSLGASGTNLIFSCNNSSGTQVFNGVISGGGSVRRNASGGSAVLNAANTYSYNTLLSNGNLGVGGDSVSTFPPIVDSGPLGTGPLVIDTGAGTPGLFAAGGPHTVANPVAFNGATVGPPLVISGSNSLTLSGTVDLSGADRTVQADNTGGTVISSPIGDSGLANGLIKTGTNTLVLSATNTYTGTTTVSNGTFLVNGQLDAGPVTVAGGILGGTGVILGAVTVQSGALAPGNNGIGTLTINNTLTLQAGSTTSLEVNKAAATADLVQGLSSVTYAGALVVANLSGTLTTNDTFKVFAAASYAGAFASVTPPPGAGLAWNTATLATDGRLRIASAPGPNPSRTNIGYVLTDNSLTLTWPADHIGWLLQAETNGLSIGLRPDALDWYSVPGSATTNRLVLPVNTTPGTVFYRLILP